MLGALDAPAERKNAVSKHSGPARTAADAAERERVERTCVGAMYRKINSVVGEESMERLSIQRGGIFRGAWSGVLG